jgi:lipase chaperone LimK
VKAVVVGTALALAGAFAYFAHGTHDANESRGDARLTSGRSALQAGAATATPFVPSFAGTRSDGAVRTEQDKLVVDQELGYLFDYYLAGIGERDLASIKAEITRELGQRLSPAAAAQARRLLDNYLGYKEALATLEQTLQPGPDMVANLRARRDAMLKLRNDYFSEAENKGLFGLADLRDADALARMEIMQDKALDAGARQARLDKLDRELPAALREERSAPIALVRLDQSVQQLRASGAGEDAVYRLRASTLSPDAAARLADVDREEAEWKSRIAAWRQERQSAKPAAEQQLRDKYFNPQEQKRLAAYE